MYISWKYFYHFLVHVAEQSSSLVSTDRSNVISYSRISTLQLIRAIVSEMLEPDKATIAEMTLGVTQSHRQRCHSIRNVRIHIDALYIVIISLSCRIYVISPLVQCTAVTVCDLEQSFNSFEQVTLSRFSPRSSTICKIVNRNTSVSALSSP